MTVDTTPSTFEYCRDWLLSSEAFVRDAMLAGDVNLDAARTQAANRIHREESMEEENEDKASAEPGPKPSIDSRPHAIVFTGEDRRTRAGTAEWRGNGSLLVAIEVLVPKAYQIKRADDSAATRQEKFRAAREWAQQLCNTIRNELLATSGQGHINGAPYLNAQDVSIYLPPAEPEFGEDRDYMAWIYEVQWL